MKLPEFLFCFLLLPTVSCAAPNVDDLIRSTKQGNFKQIMTTLRRVSPNAKNVQGYTALMEAAHRGNARVCQLLLAKGAKPDLQDASGWTALMYAANRGMDKLNSTGISPGQSSDYLQIVHLLLEAGANPNQKNKVGRTALSYLPFLWGEEGGKCKALLRKGARLTALQRSEGSFLVQAAREADSELMRLMLAQKPTQAEKDAALVQVCEKPTDRVVKPGVSWVAEGHRIIQLLLEAGANPNASNQAKETPLMLIHHSNLPAAEPTRLLLKHGASADVVDAQGRTALVHAVLFTCVDTIPLLLDAGANPNVTVLVKENKMSLLALAERIGRTQIVQLLEKAGARK